jgi:hypothetical protein
MKDALPLLLRLPRLPMKVRAAPPKREVAEWMAARAITADQVDNGVLWGCLIALPLAGSLVGAGIFLLKSLLPFLALAALMVFVIMRQYVLGLPRSLMLEENRRMAAEAPEVVGGLSIALALNPSLEEALRHDGQGGALRNRLAILQWEVTMGRSADLTAALSRLSLSFGEECQALRQALYLLLGATRERTTSGRRRLLDKANALVIDGMKERVARYAASLQLPTMAIFCFGIILPILLFTVVPMASMDLRGGGSGSTQGLTCFLLLFVVPLVILLMASGMVRRNPLRRPSISMRVERSSINSLLLVLASLLGGALLIMLLDSRPLMPLLISMPPSITVLCILRRRVASERAERGAEVELGLLLFEMGNLLQSGAGPEAALTTALSSRARGPALQCLRRHLAIHQAGLGSFREDVARDELLRRSAPMATQALLAVMSACDKDPEAAGALALDLAQYLAELQRAREGMRQQLRSLLDMMTFTACAFAPMVIGLTTSIFAVIAASGQVGGGMADADVIGGVYVLELCLVAAYLNTFIAGPGHWRGWCWRCALTCPTAALVLISASGLSDFLIVR